VAVIIRCYFFDCESGTIRVVYGAAESDSLLPPAAFPARLLVALLPAPASTDGLIRMDRMPRTEKEDSMEMTNENLTGATQLQLMMTYAAELELEVDRLRRRDQFLLQETRDHVRRIIRLCKEAGSPQDTASPMPAVVEACGQFSELLRDAHEPSGYHPAFDQVIAIAVRPLVEHVFRWQQRLSGATNAVLRLELNPDHMTWFPARLRHILDNLISNALRYRDPSKGEIRVGLALCVLKEGYELRFTDNGLGIPGDQATDMLELFYRAAPTRAAGLGVGLAVVKLLVEQCCGTIAVTSGEGQGTSITIVLPRYDVDDHVD
jgi:signal transduction histidine kinase